MFTENRKRRAVMAAALRWQGTPFHHEGRVKGAGVDCAMLLLEVFTAVGLIGGGTGVPPVQIPPYSPQWHLHREEERYLGLIRALGGREVADPRGGDLALWKLGRTYSHGAIVRAWPLIIHAGVPMGACVLDNALTSPMGLDRYPVKFFSAL
jgi:cell wall-associated NlpC family hydrolase